MNRRFLKKLFYVLMVAIIGVGFVVITQADAAEVTLAWTAGENATGYALFSHGPNGSYDFNAPIWTGDDLSTTLQNVSDTQATAYVVKAFAAGVIDIDGNATTIWSEGTSNEVVFMPDQPSAPGNPSNLTIQVIQAIRKMLDILEQMLS